MLDFTKHVGTRLRQLVTPQTDPIAGSTQVPNSDTGYVWPVDKWARLDRFLILGTEGETFYIGERTLTKENAVAVRECILEDGVRVVKRTVEISGRAAKNDPALFVLAMAAGVGDDATRAEALAADAAHRARSQPRRDDEGRAPGAGVRGGAHGRRPAGRS